MGSTGHRFARILLAAGVLAQASVATAAEVGVGADALLTRYGTSHETVNVLTIESRIDLMLGSRLTLSALVPVAGTFVHKNACCGYGLGNVTAGAGYDITPTLVEGGARAEVVASLSAPTAAAEGSRGVVSRYAATAAVTRDAGLYVPDVTAVRLAVRAMAPVGSRTVLRGSAGVHGWLANGDTSYRNQVLIPVEVAAAVRLWQHTSVAGGLTAIASPSQSRESVVHAATVTIGYAGATVSGGMRLHVPLDDSLRDVGMLGVGGTLEAMF